MKHLIKTGIRYILLLSLAIFGLKIIYPLISPITFKTSFYSLFYYSPLLLDSTSFSIENFKLNFVPACTAASAYLLLTLLTLGVDLKPKKAIKILLLGSLLIFTANIVRIDILVITLVEFGSRAFDTIHLFFWKILSSIYVVLVWIFLTKYFKIKEIPIYSDFKRILRLYRKS